MKFVRVELKIKDLTNRDKPRDVNIVAANEGWWVFGKLKFLMPGEWRFAFRAIDFRLVEGTPPQNQAPAVTLEQVVITQEGGENENIRIPHRRRHFSALNSATAKISHRQTSISAPWLRHGAEP